MDKIRTGALIKEARIKKNYTQNELGDLIGVSNKAVSRWENGDSFPDIGILESLSNVLDLKLQDIITGDVEASDETAVTEVVRVARIQQKERKRRWSRYCILIILLVYLFCFGYSALSSSGFVFERKNTIFYIILMLVSYGVILFGPGKPKKGQNCRNLYVRIMKWVSAISLVWAIFVMWCTMIMTSYGIIPFNMRLSSVGPFIIIQLTVIFLLNFVMFVVAAYRYERKEESVHSGWMICFSAMHITVLYGALLHNMIFVEESLKELTVSTLIVILSLGISLVLLKVLPRGDKSL